MARAPARSRRATSAGVKMPLSVTSKAVARDARGQALGDREVGDEGAQVAVVDADQVGARAPPARSISASSWASTRTSMPSRRPRPSARRPAHRRSWPGSPGSRRRPARAIGPPATDRPGSPCAARGGRSPRGRRPGRRRRPGSSARRSAPTGRPRRPPRRPGPAPAGRSRRGSGPCEGEAFLISAISARRPGAARARARRESPAAATAAAARASIAS